MEMVRVVEMKGTVGVRDIPSRTTTWYGPGKNLLVPASLARTLSLTLVEEESESAVDSELPEDFPHADILGIAGIGRVGQVPLTITELVEIEGIGRSRAREILDYLHERT